MKKKKAVASKSRTEEKILLYGMDDERIEAVKTVVKRLRIPVLGADDGMLGTKVGAIFGMKGFSDTSGDAACTFEQEAAVFHNIKHKRLDEVLLALKDAGITLKYKSVTTPFNVHWTLARLFDTMYKEHAYLVEKNDDGKRTVDGGDQNA